MRRIFNKFFLWNAINLWILNFKTCAHVISPFPYVFSAIAEPQGGELWRRLAVFVSRPQVSVNRRHRKAKTRSSLCKRTGWMFSGLAVFVSRPQSKQIGA